MTSPIATALMATHGSDTSRDPDRPAPSAVDGDGGDGDKDRGRPTKVYEALSVSSIGIEMGLAILVGWAVGHWLDGRLGTGPWLMLVFLACGIAAAFKPLVRLARKAKRQARESNDTSLRDGGTDCAGDAASGAGHSKDN